MATVVIAEKAEVEALRLKVVELEERLRIQGLTITNYQIDFAAIQAGDLGKANAENRDLRREVTQLLKVRGLVRMAFHHFDALREMVCDG